MDNVLKGDVSANEAMIEKWWQRYLLGEQLEDHFAVPTAFSTASNQCSKCNETSAFICPR